MRRKGIPTEIIHYGLEPPKDGVPVHDHEKGPLCPECGYRPTEEDLDRVEHSWVD